MRFAGIDVGSRFHSVAIVNEASDVLVVASTFDEDAIGYSKLFAILGPSTDILVVMEATGHYGQNLFLTLTRQGFQVALVNPLRTRRFAEEDLRRAKTDSIDALGIARFAAQKRPRTTPPLNAATAELRELVHLYDRLNQDFGDRIRQLHRLVDLCFPEFTRCVRTLCSRRAIAILGRYPTAAAFQESVLGDLAALRCHGSRVVGEGLARKLVDAARSTVGQHGSPPYRLHVSYVCKDLDELNARIVSLQVDIATRVRDHEIASLLMTIKGVGALSAARVVAAVGDPAHFRHAGAFAAYVGVVPGTNRSGLRRSDNASLCPLGNARLRKALYMAALSGVQHNLWLKAHYQRLRQNGKLPKVALIAAVRKLVVAIYSVAKHRRPFVLAV